MKAILIARVSTEEQREAGNSLPAQVARLEKYCQNKNFEIIQVCSFDESAYTNERSEFDRIIDLILAQTEKIAVCADKVDRLSRNVFDTRISVLYERALCDQIELHFVSDGQVINSRISAVEKFQFSISLGLAKYYSDAISDNVRRAQEQKLRKGEWLSKATFGYKNITRENGNTDIIVDDYNAEIIKKAFELYGTGAYSMELLCKKINTEHGLNMPKGQLGKLLSNPFYYGVMVVKGKEYPHKYPKLISQTLFDEVKKIREKTFKKPFKYAGHNYIYRGLLRCGHCDCAITPEQHKGYVYYHCTQYKGKHGAKWFREETITEVLSNAFKKLQMPPDIAQQTLQTLDELHHNKIEFHDKELEKINREQKTITKMMDNLYLDKLKGSITDSAYDKYYITFRDQMAEIVARQARLQEAEDNYYITAKYLIKLVNEIHQLFVSSEVEERRQLIKLILSNLRIEGENIEFTVQKPFDLILECADRKRWRAIDLQCRGSIGHSFGACVASLLSACKAAINLDGWLLPQQSNQIDLQKPYMMVIAQETCDTFDQEVALLESGMRHILHHEHALCMASKTLEQELYTKLSRNAYYVLFKKALHSTFSDFNVVAPVLYNQNYIDASCGLHITRALLRDFMNKYLKGKPALFIDSDSNEYPELVMQYKS